MAHRFRVEDIHAGGYSAERESVSLYLQGLHGRLHNAIHAETRVYTCRSWCKTGVVPAPYLLHWNAEELDIRKLIGQLLDLPALEVKDAVDAEVEVGAVELEQVSKQILEFEEIVAGHALSLDARYSGVLVNIGSRTGRLIPAVRGSLPCEDYSTRLVKCGKHRFS